jgi:S-adenosylmethionine hydrolase
VGRRHDTVSFLTDYGLDDEFVGVCKGIVVRIAPGATLIDVSHGVPPFDVRAGALTLLRAVPYLPDGVHLAVVDPGVGTDRRAIAVEAADGNLFVAPDNGLIGPAVAASGGAGRAVVLDPSRFTTTEPSATFWGRDVFAPAAGYLASGVELDELGDRVDVAALRPLLLPLAQRDDAGAIRAVVLWVDRFGNCASNVTEEDLAEAGIGAGSSIWVHHGDSRRERVPFVRTFADAQPGRLLAFIDSAGHLAIAVSSGSAAADLGIGPGDTLTLEPSPSLL